MSKLKRKWKSKSHQQVIKIEASGVQVSIFEILWGFEKVWFFYEFWGRRQVGQKSQRSATLADHLVPRGSFWRGRRVRRGARGERGGLIENCWLIFQCVFKSFQFRGLAGRSAWGVGSKGYHLCRQPLWEGNCVAILVGCEMFEWGTPVTL